MDLITECPRCNTRFSASLEQLQLRKGYIRCSKCAYIFDGYDAVVPDSTVSADSPVVTPLIAAGAEPSPAMPSVVRQRASSSVARNGRPGSSGSEPVHPAFVISDATRRAPPREPLVRRETDDPARAEPRLGEVRAINDRPEPSLPPIRSGRGAEQPVDRRPHVDGSHGARKAPHFAIGEASKSDGAERGISAEKAPESYTDEHDVGSRAPTKPAGLYIEPRAVRPAPESARVADFMIEDAGPFSAWIRLFWSVLIVAGLGLLLAQIAYVYRAQIAIQVPALRPVLEQACAHLKCSVAYSRRIDQISIMSSSLKAIPQASGAKAPAAKPGAAKVADAGTAESGSMTLQLTLRNNLDKPQEWPNLVLDLTDFSGALVIRKNLTPADYLTPDVLQRPFASGSEVVATVPIMIHGSQINGYQLSKYFP